MFGGRRAHELPFDLALVLDAELARRGRRQIDAGEIGPAAVARRPGFRLRTPAVLPIGIIGVPRPHVDDVTDHRRAVHGIGHPHLRARAAEVKRQRDAELVVGDDVVVVGAALELGRAAEHRGGDVGQSSAGPPLRRLDHFRPRLDRPGMGVVVERLFAHDRNMHMMGVRIGAVVRAPLPRRFLAAEDSPVGDHVLDARVLGEPQDLRQLARIHAVPGIVGDVHRGDDTILVRIVVGWPRLVRGVADRAVVRLVAARRHRIDLAPELEKTLCRSESHGRPRILSLAHHSTGFGTFPLADGHLLSRRAWTPFCFVKTGVNALSFCQDGRGRPFVCAMSAAAALFRATISPSCRARPRR